MTHDFGQKTKELGQYYTPSSIVNFIVENTIGQLLKSLDEHSSTKITILDPSVGQGAFLIGALKYLDAFQGGKRTGKEKNTKNRLKIVVNQLYGIDIDLQQVVDSRHKLGYPEFIGNIKQFDSLIPSPELSEKVNHSSPLLSLRQSYKKAFIKNDFNLINDTETKIIETETKLRKKSIQRLNGETPEISPLAWEEIFPETDGKFNVIIGNPPWGADITRIKHHLYYLKSATYQMDSWSLFIERCIIGLRKDGYLGLVVPNTLLLNPNYTQIRSILVSECQITHIVNLGEGIFPDVRQPAMIIIAKKNRSHPSDKISIITSISKETRKGILNGNIHLVGYPSLTCFQSRFTNNKNIEFDIFSLTAGNFVKIVEKDLYTDKKEICEFGVLVNNGRGVEIGRKGRVVQCPMCKKWSSPPRAKRICKTFNCSYKLSKVTPTIEIVNETIKNPDIDQPFLVGYQIQRYFIHQHKYIDPSYTGINYKTPSTYQSPKLLLRKTGKNMNWVIDYQDRWVSQVVYIFQLRENLEEKHKSISLEYLLGILNSLMMKEYVNSKFLDPDRTEFPHFVQKSILQLPIKIPQSKEEIKLRNKISDLAHALQHLYQQEYEEESKDKKSIGQIAEIQEKEEEMEQAVKTIYAIFP